MEISTSKRRPVAAFAALMLAGSGIALANAPTAEAAFTDTCVLHVYDVWTDGVNAFSYSKINCNTMYPSSNATGVGSNPQRYNWGWYDLSGENYNWSSGAFTLDVSQSGYCNGTGTSSYRGWGYGVNKKNEDQSKFGSTTSLAC